MTKQSVHRLLHRDCSGTKTSVGNSKKDLKKVSTNLKLAVPSSMESQGVLTTHVAAVTAARMAAAPQQAEQGESLDKAEKKRSRR